MTAGTTPGPSLLAAAESILPEVLAVRRRLHRRPERGLELPGTQAEVLAWLAALGVEGRPGGTSSSVVGLIEGARPGPTILLRADMDALPLHEDTGLEFASEVPGVMHACGHDTHVAMLLGAARLLAERRQALAGRVLLMFQPGEEGFEGARLMLEEGLLEDGPHGASGVERAFAIHISTRYAANSIAVRPGALLASADHIRATVRGRGGHASAPHLSLDPIPTAAELVLALQAAVTRTVDVFDPAVVTIARISGGTTHNIIPESVEVEGTIRTVSAAGRVLAQDLVRRVASGVAATHGTTVDLEIIPGYPVTMCDPAVTEWVRGLAVGLAGEGRVQVLRDPIMGAEDFSYVTERVPGAMAFLGARPVTEDPATAPQNHSNRVVFDEGSLALGAALYAAVAADFLVPAATGSAPGA
jgi:hippurate hydrolase